MTTAPLLRLLWQSYARYYDRLLSISAYRALIAQVVRMASIAPHHRVLDVGAGTGNLRGACAHGRVEWFFLDGTPAMLARAREKHADASADHFLAIDFNDPASRSTLSGTYDRILLGNSLYAAVDPVAVLRWLRTHASPGAVLVATGPWSKVKMSAVLAEHRRLSLAAGQPPRVLRLLAGGIPVAVINAVIKTWVGDGSLTAPRGPEDLLGWFSDAGWCGPVTGPSEDFICDAYGGNNWLVRVTAEVDQENASCGMDARQPA